MTTLATIDALNEEREQYIREITQAVITRIIPEVKSSLSADYPNRIEVQETLVTALTGILNQRFDELDTESEARHNAFVQQIEARFAMTATKEELAGVVKSGAENTERLTKLEASTEARLKLLEDENKALKTSDKHRAAEVARIEASAEKTAQNAQKTSEAVIELASLFKAQKVETDRELNAVKDAQKIDELALRTVQEDVLSTRSEVNDMKTTLATETDKARVRLVSLSDQVETLKDGQKTVEEKAEALEATQKAVQSKVEQYGAVYRMVDYLSKHPKISGAILGAWFFSTLCSLALLYYIATNVINTGR